MLNQALKLKGFIIKKKDNTFREMLDAFIYDVRYKMVKNKKDDDDEESFEIYVKQCCETAITSLSKWQYDDSNLEDEFLEDRFKEKRKK